MNFILVNVRKGNGERKVIQVEGRSKPAFPDS